jgi:hypothetical protein
VLAVDVDVVLVAVKGCLVLLRPARIGVLVRFFLAVPVGRNELSPIFGDGLKDQAAAVWV